MDFSFDLFHPKMVQWWKIHHLTEQDFYCRKCGKLMLDMDPSTFDVAPVWPNKAEFPSLGHNGIWTKVYRESEQNRWLFVGKRLATLDRVVFRHLCWDCFFDQLPSVVDIQRVARKGKWYGKIADGSRIIPSSSVAAAPYFTMIFDIDDEDLKLERAKYATATLEHHIAKYGEEEGRAKFKAYQDRQAYTCSKEHMQKTRGYTDEQWKQFNASRASTKENFIKRYGQEEGTKRWKDYCDNESYAGCSLQYFIDTYGEVDGPVKYVEVSNSKAITLSGMQKKYGEAEGLARFEHWLDTMAHKSYSGASQQLFKMLDTALGDVAAGSRWELKNHEAELFIGAGIDQMIVKPDYLLGRKIVEFNGDFWHANPSCYSADDLVRIPLHEQTAQSIWDHDAKRLAALADAGYEVKVVWESDFRDDPDTVADECVKFLKGEV